jgi:hypothetical protein
VSWRSSLSVQYCTTQCLAEGGEALGMMGLPQSKVRELCQEAGFGSVQQISRTMMYAVYDVRP